MLRQIRSGHYTAGQAQEAVEGAPHGDFCQRHPPRQTFAASGALHREDAVNGQNPRREAGVLLGRFTTSGC